MYRPGTLVTLKDGNVYRTSKSCVCVCDKCRALYSRFCKFPPCSGLNRTPVFSSILFSKNKRECLRLYGEYQFPKLLSLCGK